MGKQRVKDQTDNSQRLEEDLADVGGYNWLETTFKKRLPLKAAVLMLALIVLVGYLPKHDLCETKYKALLYSTPAGVDYYGYTIRSCQPDAGESGIFEIMLGTFLVICSELAVLRPGWPGSFSSLLTDDKPFRPSLLENGLLYVIGFLLFGLGLNQLISSGFFQIN